MLPKKQKRPSTSREVATSLRRKFAMLVSETEAAIANLLVSLAERLREVARIEKASKRPFQQIAVRREQRTTARLQSLARVRTILEVSAMQLLRGDWKKVPKHEVLHYIDFYQSNALSSEPRSRVCG